MINIRHPDEITLKVATVNPKIILYSVENVSDEAIQRRLQELSMIPKFLGLESSKKSPPALQKKSNAPSITKQPKVCLTSSVRSI